jgi:hypothetical protein
MPISESQLEIWSHLGSVTQSQQTYGMIRRALEAPTARFRGKHYEIFLQGSYANDTNVRGDSDVDVVIMSPETYYHDTEWLSDGEKQAWNDARIPATYGHDQFRADVEWTLRDAFGGDVRPGNKAINVVARPPRRDADVLPAFQFRRYKRFRNLADEEYTEGVVFFTSAGEQMINYPKQHSMNLTSKHQQTNGRLKPLVRILKNMRARLVDEGKLADGIAPSYFIEGLLYNVPPSRFVHGYGNCFVSCLNWLIETTARDEWLCANEQYYLLRYNARHCWSPSHCQAFLDSLVEMWNRS